MKSGTVSPVEPVLGPSDSRFSRYEVFSVFRPNSKFKTGHRPVLDANRDDETSGTGFRSIGELVLEI